jgi:rhodanese-related sulfurtransferase
MSMSLFKSPPLVKEAHQDEEEHLIGDNSKMCCLPVLKGGHHKSISAQTLCDLMDGKYRDIVESFTVIDARYPYEYNGGHIKGSVNIWNHDMLEKRFFDNLQHPCSDKRSIYIFHCEFSSKRGPAMIQHLRNMDRIKNGVPNFPKLYYPEVYLLHGGYSVFFAKAKGYCDPSSYCEMHDVNHKEDLKHFARRSKSWTAPSSYTAKRTCRLFSNPP